MTSEGFPASRSVSVFNKSRRLVIFGIIAMSVLAWIYMASLGLHATVEPNASNYTHSHHFENLLLVFFMWSIMMVAMMLPSAAPTILMFDTIIHKQGRNASRVSPTFLFISGYLATWIIYSGLAAIWQIWLQNNALVTTVIVKSVPSLSGTLLIIAGLFQFSHLKYSCLKHCRSPMGFFMLHWQEGRKGAFLMGVRSGLYCVGCCWVLMILMFVAGAMNIIWMLVLAVFILVEKLIPWGRQFGQISGFSMIAWGLWILSHL